MYIQVSLSCEMKTNFISQCSIRICWTVILPKSKENVIRLPFQGHCWLVRREQGQRQHSAMEEEEPAALRPALRGSEGTGSAGDGDPQPGQPLAGKHWDPSPTLPPTSPPQSAALWHTAGRPASPRPGWRGRRDAFSSTAWGYFSLFLLTWFALPLRWCTSFTCFTSLLSLIFMQGKVIILHWGEGRLVSVSGEW